MGRNFEFQVQDSFLKYFLFENGRFEKTNLSFWKKATFTSCPSRWWTANYNMRIKIFFSCSPGLIIHIFWLRIRFLTNFWTNLNIIYRSICLFIIVFSSKLVKQFVKIQNLQFRNLLLLIHATFFFLKSNDWLYLGIGND